MIHVMNFMVKVIATIAWSIANISLGLLSIILWDSKYLEVSDEIWSLIWKKKQTK